MTLRRLFRAAESTQAELRRGETAGRWRLIERGVYGEGRAQPTALGRALVPFVRRHAVVCGAVAGVVHDLDSVRLAPSAPKRRPPVPTLLIDGWLPCTDGRQTLVDLAATLDDRRWEHALESALRKGLCTVADLVGALPGLGRARTPGTARIRRVLELRPPGAPPTESLLETLMVQLARRTDGVPEPTRQVVVENRYGNFVARVDLAWPGLGLFVELDGQHHPASPCTTPTARPRSSRPRAGCAGGSPGPRSFASRTRQAAGCATSSSSTSGGPWRKVRRPWRVAPRGSWGGGQEVAFDVADRRQSTDRRSGTVDRRARGDRRAAAAPTGIVDRRTHHDRRSAYPDRRVHLFDRRTLTLLAPDLAPRPKSRRSLPDPMVPVVAIAVLSLADVVTTDRLADLGGSEVNPLSQWLLDRNWLLTAKILAVGILAVFASRAGPSRWIPTALWAVAGVYAAVVALHGWQLLS